MKSKNNKNWYILDLKHKYLGRESSRIANILIGKHKPEYNYYDDCGDFVVVVNSSDIKISGNKSLQKCYYKHSGYIGNLKSKSYKELEKNNVSKIIKNAVYGMLPKNKLRKVAMNRLKIYINDTHPHKNIKFINLS